MWWTCWYASSLSAISFVAVNKLHPLLTQLRTRSINEPEGCTNAVMCHVPVSLTMMSLVNGIDSETLWLIWQCLHIFRPHIADVELQRAAVLLLTGFITLFYCALWPQHNHWSTAAVDGSLLTVRVSAYGPGLKLVRPGPVSSDEQCSCGFHWKTPTECDGGTGQVRACYNLQTVFSCYVLVLVYIFDPVSPS